MAAMQHDGYIDTALAPWREMEGHGCCSGAGQLEVATAVAPPHHSTAPIMTHNTTSHQPRQPHQQQQEEEESKEQNSFVPSSFSLNG